MATIATSNDPQWFENKGVKQFFTSHGGKFLSKFIEKFKEVKKVENQKKSSLSTVKKDKDRNDHFPEKRKDVISYDQ